MKVRDLIETSGDVRVIPSRLAILIGLTCPNIDLAGKTVEEVEPEIDDLVVEDLLIELEKQQDERWKGVISGVRALIQKKTR